jgi:hypothetical protein
MSRPIPLTLEEARQQLPLPHGLLIEHLEEKFGALVQPVGTGLDGAIDTAIAHATVVGERNVINYLASLLRAD